jgi:hypothetical protein
LFETPWLQGFFLLFVKDMKTVEVVKFEGLWEVNNHASSLDPTTVKGLVPSWTDLDPSSSHKERFIFSKFGTYRSSLHTPFDSNSTHPRSYFSWTDIKLWKFHHFDQFPPFFQEFNNIYWAFSQFHSSDSNQLSRPIQAQCWKLDLCYRIVTHPPLNLLGYAT